MLPCVALCCGGAPLTAIMRTYDRTWARLNKNYDVITLRWHYYQISIPCKIRVLGCLGALFNMKFLTAPPISCTKFWTHTPHTIYCADFRSCVWFTVSLNSDVMSLNTAGPWTHLLALTAYFHIFHTIRHLHINTTQYYTNVPRVGNIYLLKCLHKWHGMKC